MLINHPGLFRNCLQTRIRECVHVRRDSPASFLKTLQLASFLYILDTLPIHRGAWTVPVFIAVLLFAISVTAQTCANMPGSDMGAKINALIASKPNGGSIDCSEGFSSAEILTTPVVLRNATFNLRLSLGTTIIAHTGANPAFTIGE